MSVPEIQSKIKTRVGALLADETVFLAALLIAVSAASFMLGRISVSKVAESSVRLETAALSASLEKGEAVSGTAAKTETQVEIPTRKEPSESAAGETKGQYVGSKNSNKYHLPWCSGAKTISEENKVWFASKEEAESKGYVPASNCKGI